MAALPPKQPQDISNHLPGSDAAVQFRQEGAAWFARFHSAAAAAAAVVVAAAAVVVIVVAAVVVVIVVAAVVGADGSQTQCDGCCSFGAAATSFRVDHNDFPFYKSERVS